MCEQQLITAQVTDKCLSPRFSARSSVAVLLSSCLFNIVNLPFCLFCHCLFLILDVQVFLGNLKILNDRICFLSTRYSHFQAQMSSVFKCTGILRESKNPGWIESVAS